MSSVTALARLYRSAAFRLSLVFVLIFTIGAGVVGYRVASGFRHIVAREVETALDAEIESLSEQARIGGLQSLIDAVERRAREPDAAMYLVTDGKGALLAGNAPQIVGQLDSVGVRRIDYMARDARPRPRGEGERAVRRFAFVRVAHLDDIGARLLVGRDFGERERLGRIMRRSIGETIAWMALVGVLAGIVASFRAMRRVDAMNAAAGRVTQGDLETRLPRNFTGDDLDRLGASVNAMVERNSALLRGMREVTDNVAHDLKTPLTRLRNRAEEALRAPAGAERAALERVIEESDDLIRVFDALLMIARAESGAAIQTMEPFDLSAQLVGLCELYEPAAEADGSTLRCDVEPDVIVTGQRELIGQAVANLIDNALKHGARAGGGAIQLVVRRRGDAIEIAVADNGAGVPAVDRERVLDRFVRLERARSKPGSGLGLSLALAAARVHGGVLALTDNRPGLRATLTLPLLPRRLEPTS